jgi:hypothetical protein
MRRRSNIGGPPLLPAPPGFAIRKADYAFDLDAPGYREYIERIFAAHDRDGDGVIIIGEYDVAQPAAAQSAAASPAAPAEASVVGAARVLDRYVDATTSMAR